ncbi:MAG: HigA family addiction module antitoxin [Chloroflexi bacterium]|nr:HigA family addiction module antitoxin [Chloroflexota bacterium]
MEKMIPENRIPTHPGVVLEEEFLIPLNLTQVALAKHLGVSTQRINELVRGKRGVTPETAWLLAGAWHNTAILAQFAEQLRFGHEQTQTAHPTIGFDRLTCLSFDVGAMPQTASTLLPFTSAKL